MRTCVRMVVCVLFSRFALVAALGDRRELMGEPVALAPEAGRRQMVGEVSPAAEAFGVVPGMRVGEALARCPELRLVPPDSDGVRTLWRRAPERLQRVGGARECERGAGGAAPPAGPIARARRSSPPTGCAASTAAGSMGCSTPRARLWGGGR